MKQVIVIRKDLNMRKGKMIAQGAHASMKVLLDLMKEEKITKGGILYKKRVLTTAVSDNIDARLSGLFTKVCVYVTSEDELLDLHYKAITANLPVSLIEDCGLTEFNGVKTNTCIAIGPGIPEDIDKLTGELKLL